MPPNRVVHEILVAPLPVLLAETAAAVSEAQVSLDERAMVAQQRLDELTDRAGSAAPGDGAPEGLARFQIEAPWYHFSEVEVEIKLSMSIEASEEDRGGRRVVRPRLSAVPHNARSQNLTGFEAQGTSRLRARLAAVPPPPRSR